VGDDIGANSDSSPPAMFASLIRSPAQGAVALVVVRKAQPPGHTRRQRAVQRDASTLLPIGAGKPIKTGWRFPGWFWQGGLLLALTGRVNGETAHSSNMIRH
jgi:hypothetical protein